MKKTILFLVMISVILIPEITNAAILKGKIFGKDGSQKQPLAGATLYWYNTKTGTISKKNGEFEINRVSSENKLIVSYVGFTKDTIEVPVMKSYLEIELESELELGEVIVTANQGTIVSKASIVQSEQITMQGLRKAACCNLGESFQTNATVDVEYTDAVTGAKQIQLLGLDGSYTQIMTEKVPNLRGIGSTYGLNYIPGPWMESIQISKGAASVSTGYESITGQINVEYKKPATSEPLFINLFANQYGRFEGDLNTGYKFNEELSTMLLFHGNRMNQKIDYNGDKFLDIPMDDQINVMNRWNYDIENYDLKIAVKGLYEDRRGGQSNYFTSSNPIGIYGLNIHTERYEAFLKNGIVFPGENYNSLALIISGADHKQYSFFGNNHYTGKQKSLYANLIYQFAFESGQEEDEHSEMNQDETQIENDSTENINEESKSINDLSHNITSGLSWQFDEFDEVFKSNPLFRTENVPGVFTEYTLKGFYGLTLVGGLRADFHNLYGTFITPRFHLRYELNPSTIMRASFGKGYHTANIYSENTGVMASSREFIIKEKLKPEEAWNYGMNISTDFYLGDLAFTLNADYYRTDFINQVILDLDMNPQHAAFYNLNGKSYSNSFQLDLTFEPLTGLEVVTAYRLNDVKMTFDGKLQEKPMVNKHKGFMNISYTNEDADWVYDFTFNLNGGGRLPNTSMNPEPYRLANTYPAYILLFGQIEKKFEQFSIYLGAENITDYKQPNPILAYDKPFGEYFDSSMIYAPIAGRVIYAGLRFNLK